MLDNQCVQKVFVPNLYRFTQMRARKTLEKSGFKLGQVRWMDSDLPQGLVVQQQPIAHSNHALGSSVDVWMADVKQVLVPNLVGSKQIAAGTLLYEKGLRLGEITRENSKKASGIVLSQDPEADTRVAVNSLVTIVVSQHVIVHVNVPNLIGLKQAEAQALLSKNKLKLGHVSKPESAKPDGLVFAQQPRVNKSVALGTAVEITISKQMVNVPTLTGHQRADVKNILRNNHLKVGQITTQNSDQPGGIVLSQDPKENQRVRVDSAVSFVVSNQQVKMPDVMGMSARKAVETLKSASLTVGLITKKASMDVDDEVLEQSQDADAMVDIHSSVDLVVAELNLVTVPDLFAMDVDSAKATLHEHGLLLGALRSEISQQKEGSVLSQDPVAGQKVKAGFTVAIRVAEQEVAVDRTWLFIAAGALLTLCVAGATYSFRARSNAPGVTLATLAPSLRVKAHHDSGSPQAIFEGAKTTGHEIQFKPVADKGEQHLTIDDADGRIKSGNKTGDEK